MYADSKVVTDALNAGSSVFLSRKGFERRLALVAALAVALIAAVSLAGCLLDIEILKTFWPHGAEIKPNSALALLAGAASLALAILLPRARAVQAGLALAVSSFGCAVLLEYALGVDFGIDNLVFRDPSPVLTGRPPMPAAAALDALGLALALLSTRSAALHLVRAALAVVIMVIAFTGFLGFFVSPFGPTEHHTLFQYPLHGGVALFLLGLGVLATNRSTARSAN